MSNSNYLLVHKDHWIDLGGVNSGAETATLWLARTLARQGCRVVVAAQLRGGDAIWNGVEFWDLGATFDVQAAITRAQTLGSYNLIAACRALPILLSRQEKCCASRFFIAHDPSAGALGIKPEVLCNIVDGVICVSEAQKQLFVKEGGIASKITVVPNGADDSTFCVSNIARSTKKLVFAGALVQDKGVDILLRAFQQVKASVPDASLDIYGSSAMWGREPLFNQTEIEAAIPGVKFHGSVPQTEIARAFQGASACVIASRWFDSFPLTAVEAQACGCPIVAFDVGGVKESFAPNSSGLLVGELSEKALAQALVYLLNNPQLQSDMSRAGVKLVAEKFSWDRVTSKIRSLCENTANNTAGTKKKLGVVSTWNQQCGLSTYAKYLWSQFDQNTLVVFSEEGKRLPELTDESFVQRCWSKERGNFDRLKSAITQHEIGLLHVNMHSVRYFAQPAWGEFLAWVKAQNIALVIHLHSTFTRDEHFAALVKHADKLIVHAEQNRLEVIANGASADQVFVLPHGVKCLPELSTAERDSLRARLGMTSDTKIIVAFGFAQPHKGFEGVLEAVLHCRNLKKNARGIIVGGINPDDSRSADYLRQLKALTAQHGLTDSIVFLDRFVSDQEVSEYLQAADLVMMNYKSQHYEASGACSLAVGAGAVVATSGAPPFIAFGDAVWHLTAGYQPALTAELLLFDGALSSTLRANARVYRERFSWPNIAAGLIEFYRSACGFIPSAVEKKPHTISENQRPLRVLMQNRPGTFTQRGGDTIVLERTAEELKRLGVEVQIDVAATENAAAYDLVHLFNFATPQFTRQLGERAAAAGKPFVVTTLLEDVPQFHNQSVVTAQALMGYVTRGQDKTFWAGYKDAWRKVQPSASFDNEWLVRNAAALLTNGSRETETVRRYYPFAKNTIEVKLGHEVPAAGDPQIFIDAHGVKDFVLCVGRIESRKNQLMLLKALEDSDLPVVLLAGGFTYQPDYDAAVRNFKRRGKTIIIGRVSPEMLASAYAAAKVHALPSWYELPGLVSLEAASHGCAVVVGDNGTTRDYFGDLAHYCAPGDEVSIRTAIEAAYQAPKNPELKAAVAQFRWDGIGESTLTIYENILGRERSRVKVKQGVIMAPSTQTSQNAAQPNAQFGSYDLATEATEFQELLERGELAAKSAQFARAHELLAKAEQLNPTSVRTLKSRGAVFLAEDKIDSAKSFFERAWALDQKDERVLCGLGMCESRSNHAVTAYRYFVDALAVAPNSQIAILQLIPCASVLGKYDDLERALSRYVDSHPDDMDMQYCLGGCFFKMGRSAEASATAKVILAREPGNERAKELFDLAATAMSQVQPTQPRSAMQSVERVAIPSSPQAKPVSQASGAIDLEIGKLEESKRMKRLDEVRAGTEDLLSRVGISPEQRELLLCLKAEVAIMDGKVTSAASTYTEVLDVNPSSARGLTGRAVIAAHENRWDEARSLFERANTYRPRYDVALAGLGLCAWQAGDENTAWERFQQALQINPENTRALLGVVQIGYPQKRYTEIETALKNYLDLHPADLDWTYSLAGCCYAQEKFEDAREALQQITLFDPTHEKANELLQMIDKRKTGSTAFEARPTA